MGHRVAAVRREVERGIRAGGKRRGDQWLQKYVGSPVPVLGLGTAEMRAILDGFAKAHPDLDARPAHALADPPARGGGWRPAGSTPGWAGASATPWARGRSRTWSTPALPASASFSDGPARRTSGD